MHLRLSSNTAPRAAEHCALLGRVQQQDCVLRCSVLESTEFLSVLALGVLVEVGWRACLWWAEASRGNPSRD